MKRVGFLFLVLLLLVSGAVFAGRSFSDVSSKDWFYTDLMEIANDARGILDGYPDGTYRPNVDLQVDQFIKTVVKAAGYDVANAEGYWAQSHIDKALEEGFISAGDFSDYRRQITRQEMATIVVKVMEQMESVSYSKSSEIEQALADKSSISSKNKSDVLKVYELGIITGYPDGTFKPKNTLPRREAAVVLRRMIDASARQPFESSEVPVGDIVYEDHFVGGSEWVNPVTASDEENVAEDLLLIESDDLFYHYGGGNDWEDQASLIITFVDEKVIPLEQMDSLQRILSRRIDVAETELIIEYIMIKTSWSKLLPEKTKNFQIGSYLVEVEETRIYPNTPYERAKSIEVQIWYEYEL